MMVACKLCGQLIEAPAAFIRGLMDAAKNPGPNVPVVGDTNRAAIEYQATIQTFAGHLAQAHPEYPMLLAQTAQTYHLQLIAKLATSADPHFEEERENARALCYWTLAGELEFDRRPLPPKV